MAAKMRLCVMTLLFLLHGHCAAQSESLAACLDKLAADSRFALIAGKLSLGMPCVEVGWRLAKEHWGQGYATEAAKGALRTGFDRIGLREIVSFTSLVNRPSRAVMQRIGMVDTAEDFDHPALPEGSELRRHCLYRISRAQWERDAAWRRLYLGDPWDHAKVRGSNFNYGDGLKMAMDIGAMPWGHWGGCHAPPAHRARARAIGQDCRGTRCVSASPLWRRTP